MRFESELEKHVKEQLGRIRHLPGFPTDQLAIRDYIAALLTAGTRENVSAILDDITRTEWIRCPDASVLRRMAWDRGEGQRQRQRECSVCNGSGFFTIWRLVTYVGNSYKVKAYEDLIGIKDQEQADAFVREKLIPFEEKNPHADKQTVISAAAVCRCRKPQATAGIVGQEDRA